MKTKKEIFISRINKNGDWVDGMETQCWNFIPKNPNYEWGKKQLSFNLGNGVTKTIQLCSFIFFINENHGGGNIFSRCKNSKCVNPSHLSPGDSLLASGVEFYKDGGRFRTCPRCKNSFPKTDEYFYVNKSGIFLKCKQCSIETVQTSRVSNWARVLLYEAQKRNKESGIECTLILEDIENIYKNQGGRCYWTGVEMTPSAISKYPSKPSLDRLDRFGGYTLDNVVLCCLAINIGRNSSSKEDFENFVIELQQKGIDTNLWK